MLEIQKQNDMTTHRHLQSIEYEMISTTTMKKRIMQLYPTVPSIGVFTGLRGGFFFFSL